MELFDKDGTAVEALTPEEVDEKLNEAREQAIEETNSAREAEFERLRTQIDEKDTSLQTAQAELEAEKSKDKNLAGQRKVIESKEKEIADLKKGLDELGTKLDTSLQALTSKERVSMVNGMIKTFAGSNSALSEKIRFFYDQFKGDPKDDKEMEDRVKNAFVLAGGGQRMSIGSEIIGAGAGAPTIVNPSGEKLKPEATGVAKNLGITDQELKKHGLI